ncbi:RNA polymerase factor sigma-70 [compost metagenome]
MNTTEGAVKAALYRARQNLAEVRRELAAEGPAAAGGEDFRQLLAALADAYVQGQIPVMLELLRQDHTAELTMAVSAAPVQARLITSRMSTGSNAMYSGLRMAA